MASKRPFLAGFRPKKAVEMAYNGSGPEVRQHLNPGLTLHHSTRPRSKG